MIRNAYTLLRVILPARISQESQTSVNDVRGPVSVFNFPPAAGFKFVSSNQSRQRVYH